MAEWLGQLMNGWPTWIIGVAIVVIAIIGFAIYWITYLEPWTYGEEKGKRKNGKK
jgi:hypothetical protein